MALTKSDLVKQALQKLAVTGFDAEINPEEIKAGVITLEEMMAAWDAQGIKCGYKFAALPETADAEADAGVPDIARQAIAYNLAILRADAYGKQVSQSVLMMADAGMTALLAAIAFIPTMQYPGRMPRGSGNTLRYTRWTRYYRPQDTLDADNAGPIDTNGQGALQP